MHATLQSENVQGTSLVKGFRICVYTLQSGKMCMAILQSVLFVEYNLHIQLQPQDIQHTNTYHTTVFPLHIQQEEPSSVTVEEIFHGRNFWDFSE